MLLTHVLSCATYFGYGAISNDIISDSFTWDGNEEFIINKEVLSYLNYHADERKMYFFTTRSLWHPITFRDKHFGLWKNYALDYHLDYTDASEKRVSLKRYELLYGVCKIELAQLNSMLNHINFISTNSFIILGKDSGICLDEIEKYLKITNSNDQIDYVSLINSFCTRGHKVVTKIEGLDGTSINIFYIKNN